MMKIEILGTGCSRCKQLHQNAMQAVLLDKLNAEVVKVEDIKQIIRYGVMSTPALVIDGQIKSVGRVPSVEEIRKLIV